MQSSPAIAQSFADRNTEAELQAIQDACLDVFANSGEVSINSGSGSITVSRENCEHILANVAEALRIKAGGSTDPDLNRTAAASGFNFSNRRIS